MLDAAQLRAVEQHLGGVLGAELVEIVKSRRFHGGASRETYAIDVIADAEPLALILRKDPPASLIDTARAVEFAALQSFQASDLPIPRPLTLVEEESIIGAPFFIMERIEGGEAAGPMDPGAYGEHKALIGAQFFSFLGKIHAVEPAMTPLAEVIEVPDAAKCHSRELEYWSGIIEKDALEPEPIAHAAVRWLRKNTPPAAQRLAIVHGDYRNGNVLHDGQGKLVAILDWEMAHIGDPLEDLAWAMDPMWNLRDPEHAAGLLPRAEAITHWEAASGLRFEPAAFRWWEMFATLKGLAIWISSSRAYASAANTDPILAFSGWYPKIEANRLLAARLGS